MKRGIGSRVVSDGELETFRNRNGIEGPLLRQGTRRHSQHLPLPLSLQKSLRAYLPKSRRAKRQSSLLGVAALALAGSAVLVGRRAAKAERDYPAKGRFITVDGVRLHYMERGSGQPVVFMHGNGAMIDDMLISGVFDQAAEHYRAIVFDRPGFGHSARPRDRSWTAAAQAALFASRVLEMSGGRSGSSGIRGVWHRRWREIGRLRERHRLAWPSCRDRRFGHS